MCGIVGYYGPENPVDVIIKGLKTLEYRGYDSAGVAILNNGVFKRVRAEGKLSHLEKKLSTETFNGHLGVGHTRWATHGPPVEKNAHPHVVGGASIVHNGIIENYAELKDQLIKAGSIFHSDTDSELIAHLVSHEIEIGKDLFHAVIEILPKLEGAYSVLAVHEKYPEEIVAFKSGPPLVVGKNEKEVVVASDLQAIMPYTKNVVFLQDNEILHVTGTKIEFFDDRGQKINKKETKVDWNPELIEKQGYDHYMLKEIYEQPRAVAMAMGPHVDLASKEVRLCKVGFGVGQLEDLEQLEARADWENTLKTFEGVERVFMVACGTSFYAGMVGEYLIERLSKIPVECDIASEFRYRHPVIPKNSLVVVVSQSGETADTLAALRLAREAGAKVLSICNVKNSSMDREADGHLYMNAGVEIGVASTKALSSTIALMNCLAVALGKAKKQLNEGDEHKFVEALLAAPSHMESVLAYDKFFAEAADTLKDFRGFLYMGRGIHYPIALEGALKMKELAYMHAEGYAAGEMKHGPLALIDQSMAIIMLAPSDELYDKTVSNLEEAKARGGKIISIGSGKNEKLEVLSDHYLALPEVEWTINPLLELIPLQLMSYHVADRLGKDIDQPRNLAKSVTVE
ncbi:MAG: glutamine--fructose-6-phosphate transaminase (isomerizing) [Bdellovibrionales bacterium]|nr:glutamine--fructose-6-phosphate transaminase (isomerizing) [Bdellovibrionales bacterium]